MQNILKVQEMLKGTGAGEDLLGRFIKSLFSLHLLIDQFFTYNR